MEQLVRFLTGHERAVFTNGRFGFDLRPHAAVLLIVALLFLAFIYFTYVRPGVRAGGRSRHGSPRRQPGPATRTRIDWLT